MLKNAKLLLVPSLGIVAEIIDQILKEEPQTGRVFNLINQYSAFITLNIVRSESHSPYFCNKESTTAKETSTMGQGPLIPDQDLTRPSWEYFTCDKHWQFI